MSGLLSALNRIEGRTTAPHAPPPADVLRDELPTAALWDIEQRPRTAPVAEPPDDPIDEAVDEPVDDAPSAEVELPLEPEVAAAPFPPASELPPAPAAPVVERGTGFAPALADVCHAPALVAFLGVGLDEPLAPTLRVLAEEVAAEVGRDIILLGPGVLDDPATLDRHASSLREQAAYGFVHAAAEYAVGRLDGLARVAGVVAVVDLERTSTRAVESIRDLLAARGIKLFGVVALRGE